MTITRRGVLRGLGAGLAAAPARAATRPNVLVVMSDQESALLPGPVRLPNRAKLLERGTSFRHAFCLTPQCSASRASLLTGREPHRTGVVTNVDETALGRPLPPEMPNVGSVFQHGGYATGYFGKWHLGGKGLAGYGFAHHHASNESRGVDDQAVAQAAAEWVGQQRGPWLAWVSLLNPHHIYSFPERKDSYPIRAGVRPPHSDRANLAGKPTEQTEFMEKDQGRQAAGFTREQWLRYRSLYLDLVEQVDGHLGVLLGALRDWPNTAVVYTTDHGDALGEHGLPYKGPFLYEEGVRVPLVVSAPSGPLARRSVRDELVTLADVAPTLAGLAGLSWPEPTEGRDLSRAAPERDAVRLEYYSKQKWVNPIRAIRTREWKLSWYDRGAKELYDLRRDPHELVNLAGRPEAARVQQELERRVGEWRGPMLPQAP